MSKMVSARVPNALYEQASLLMESLGFTTSELVNAAFEYVLKERSLPHASAPSKKIKKRSLSNKQKNELAEFFDRCTIANDMPFDEFDYKKILREGKIDDYEALA